jgi:hypothetical protein
MPGDQQANEQRADVTRNASDLHPPGEGDLQSWNQNLESGDEDGQNSMPRAGTDLRIMLRWPILLQVDIAAASTASKSTRLPVHQLWCMKRALYLYIYNLVGIQGTRVPDADGQASHSKLKPQVKRRWSPESISMCMCVCW